MIFYCNFMFHFCAEHLEKLSCFVCFACAYFYKSHNVRVLQQAAQKHWKSIKHIIISSSAQIWMICCITEMEKWTESIISYWSAKA